MIDFIGSTYTSAMIAWGGYFGFTALGLETVGAAIGMTALLLSVLAFSSTIIGAVAWIIRHVRIRIV